MQWFSCNLLDFSVSFLSILFEGAPFMFIGTLIAGFVDAFVPAHVIERMLPRNISLAVGLSAVLGVAFPMCECGLHTVNSPDDREGNAGVVRAYLFPISADC